MVSPKMLQGKCVTYFIAFDHGQEKKMHFITLNDIFIYTDVILTCTI